MQKNLGCRLFGVQHPSLGASRGMLHPIFRNPCGLGKFGSMWGTEKPEQVAWPGPVSADLPGNSYTEPQLQ